MKIGIIAAMQDELSLLTDRLEESTSTRVGRFTFNSGKINGSEIALLLSGVGKVNAAAGTAILLDRFKPDYVINTGVAGGLSDKIRIGEVVISSDARHYDANATAFGYEIGQIPQMPAAYRADDYLLKLAKFAGLVATGKEIYCGSIISGDSFVHTDEQINYIANHFPDVMAIEMEGAAIAQTCFLFSTPFILIRSISDKVRQPGNQVDYQSFTRQSAENAIKIVLAMLERLKESSYEKN